MKRDFLRAFVFVLAFLLLVAEVQRRDEPPAAIEYQQ
jgi:hypothetical protein